MDSIINFIERLVQAIVSGLNPLVESGGIGYVAPFLLLAVVTVVMLTSSNRLSWAGYGLGWIVALFLILTYQNSGGDRWFADLTGTIPRSEVMGPVLWGLAAGFLLLFPFVRTRLHNSTPIIIAFVTGMAIILLFLAWRVTALTPVVQTSGQEELIAYRRRYVGVFALAFGVGVLLHVLLSATNEPRTPAVPPQQTHPPGM